MFRRNLFRSPEGENPGGGGPANQNNEPRSDQTGGTPPPANNPPADPPPAADVVNKGAKTERELALEQELEAERNGRKKDQTRLSELEDENHRLKEIPADRSKPKTKKSAGPISRILGWDED